MRFAPNPSIPVLFCTDGRVLLTTGGTLDGNAIVVTSEQEHVDTPSVDPHDTHPIDQTDKPRAGIAAEYLARGYTLSDSILERAIALDQKQGISSRFLSYIKSLDATVGQKALGPDQTVSGKVVDTLRSVDETRGVSKSAGDVSGRGFFLGGVWLMYGFAVLLQSY